MAKKEKVTLRIISSDWKWFTQKYSMVWVIGVGTGEVFTCPPLLPPPEKNCVLCTRRSLIFLFSQYPSSLWKVSQIMERVCQVRCCFRLFPGLVLAACVRYSRHLEISYQDKRFWAVRSPLGSQRASWTRRPGSFIHWLFTEHLLGLMKLALGGRVYQSSSCFLPEFRVNWGGEHWNY